MKAEPALKMDFKSKHNLAKSFSAKLGQNEANTSTDESLNPLNAEKEAVDPRNQLQFISIQEIQKSKELKQKPLKDNGGSYTINHTLQANKYSVEHTRPQERVQMLRGDLEIAMARIDEYKQDNLTLRQENKRLTMAIEKRDLQVNIMSKAFDLKNNELVVSKDFNLKLIRENCELQRTLEKQKSELASITKTNVVNIKDLETEKSLANKLSLENRSLKTALERRNSEFCTSSKTFGSKENELAPGESLYLKLCQQNNDLQTTLEKQNADVACLLKTNAKTSEDLKTVKSLTVKLSQENKKLRIATEKNNSVRYCSSQFQASLMDIFSNKDGKEINTLKVDEEMSKYQSLKMEIQKLGRENLKLRKALAKKDATADSTRDAMNNTVKVKNKEVGAAKTSTSYQKLNRQITRQIRALHRSKYLIPLKADDGSKPS